MSLPAPPAPALGPVPGAVFHFRTEPSGRFSVEPVTPGAESFFEAGPSELADMLSDRRLLLDGEDPAAFYASIEAAVTGRRAWEKEFRFRGSRTGRPRWSRVQALPLADAAYGTRPAWIVLAVDTTAARQAETDLRAAFQKLSSHLENTPLAVVEWDDQMRVVRWSRRAEDLFGWAAHEVLGKRVADWRFVHPDDAPRIAEIGARLATGAAPHAVVQNRNYHKSGRVLVCEWHNSVLTDDRGGVASVLSLVLDRTAETAARAAAARNEERLQTALRFAGMLGWDLDLKTREAFYSDDYHSFYGLPGPFPGSDGTLAGADQHYRVIHPDDRPAVAAEIAAAVADRPGFRVEFRGAAPGPDGRDRWFTSRGRVVRGADGTADRVVGVTTDVTARKRDEASRAAAEAELQEARRLESLALLAGGVAHDLNNVLTVILGSAEVLRTFHRPNPDTDRLLTGIESGCARASELCRQITAYAGTGRVRNERLDLNRLVREATQSARRPDGKAVRVALDLDPGEPRVVGDAHQLRLMLGNLIRHAAGSDPGTGEPVGVRTDELVITEPGPQEGWLLPVAPFRYAVVDVRLTDDGAETVAGLTRPFANPAAGVAGLGLAAAAGVVRSHRGSLRVNVAAGTGVVRVLLPAPVEQAAPARVPARPPLGVALVVDDEPNIRELAAVMLEDLGFTVVAAADGRGGWDAFRADADRFTLVVLDLTMPGMNGADLLRRVWGVRKDVPAVVMTGYTHRDLAETLGDDPRFQLLLKPFRIEQFQAAVAAATGR